MSRVLLGVTGGIAAYKACELCRLLVKEGQDVVPLVTPGAERFVTAETFRALARRPPGDDVYLHLTRADLLVVAPCTANTLAKIAHGLADNVLTEAALAHRGPILLAPAMNPRMWAAPATRANVETLQRRNVELVGPDEGEMAEGEWGVGRMAEPEEIAARVAQLLAPGSLAGRRVLVTAGGTREPVDSVRFVGNRASGRMGVALAEEARRRGAGHRRRARRAQARRPGARRVRRRARRGGARAQAADARDEERRPRRLQRRLARGHRLRCRGERGRARDARGRAARSEGVEAADRRGDPRRGREASLLNGGRGDGGRRGDAAAAADRALAEAGAPDRRAAGDRDADPRPRRRRDRALCGRHGP